MIQMVGPADNDYIYIDFKDFKYDQKWEFPRENLELGTQPRHIKTMLMLCKIVRKCRIRNIEI